MGEQDEVGTTGTGSRRARLRARFTRRPPLRPAALVAAGLVAGAVLGGVATAGAADRDRGGWSREDDRGGPGGHGGRDGERHGNGPGAGEEALTGDTARQVAEAVLAEYPDAGIERLETDADGVYEAHIVTADGEELTVELDEEFAVTGTE